MFEQNGCIWAKVVVLGQGDCIWHKWFYSGKVVVVGQFGCNLAKVVVFGQKWLYSGKSGYIGQSG